MKPLIEIYSMNFESSHRRSPISLHGADVDEHEEDGDEEGHPPRHLVHGDHESDEGCRREQPRWHVGRDHERDRHPRHGHPEAAQGHPQVGGRQLQGGKSQVEHLGLVVGRYIVDRCYEDLQPILLSNIAWWR